MEQIKVLQVTAALDQGGVERGTVEMAAFIVKQGAKSYVASQGGRLVPELVAQGSEHVALPLARRNPLTVLYAAFRLRALIRDRHITLVHARSRAPAWAALLACRMTGTPFVTTFHGTHRIQNRVKKFYNSVMTRGRRVIAISDFIRRHVLDNYGVDPRAISVAPRGFDPERINPERVGKSEIASLRATLKLDDDVPVIILPGRLTRWKGQALFLDALGRISDLAWQALIVGGAGQKTAYLDELKQAAERFGIAGRVHFVGDQSDIVPFYAVADLVVSASTEPEAFGRVAVEGQAMGKPVVASAHGGALETVRDGKTGWLFRNNDAADFAAKLRIALAPDTDRADIGRTARRFVEEEYTVEKMCRAEWDAYRLILGETE